MKSASAVSRNEARLLGLLLTVALVLSAVMTWHAVTAQRRHRQAAMRVVSDYAAIIAEELARRIVFEYEEFGFRPLRNALYASFVEQGRLLSAAELRNDRSGAVRSAAVVVEQTFLFDFAGARIEPSLRPDLQQWALLHFENVVKARRGMPAWRRTVRVSLAGTDRWVLYMDHPDLGPRRIIGVVIRNEGLSALAQRALARRSPFPVTLGDRLTQRDLYFRLYRPRLEILRTEGTFDARYGRRVTLPPALGEILGGAVAECSISPRVIPLLVIGGIPTGNERASMAMLVTIACVLGAVLLVLRRARELDRLRAEFVAGVSHELRTPLTQIRMFAEMLMLSRVRSEGDRARALQNIARETTRLSNLVENLLSLSRGERNDLRVVRTEHDVCAIVRDAVTAFAPLASQHRVAIRTDLPERCSAAVDEDAVRQIVLNLLDNAVRYGPPQQTVTVAVIPGGEGFRIVVEDEGPGIPPAERNRIWMKFYRLERDREAHHSGSGIGLAVVRELVERHDGRCAVEDDSRGGARFVVDIPWGERAS